MTELLTHQTDEYRIASENLCFHDVDPKYSEIVYHATTEAALPSIAEHGLVASYEGVHKSVDWFDSLRPKDIPVSLKQSVYAQIQGGHIIDLSVDGVYMAQNSEFKRDGEAIEMLAVAVDPKKTYVIDMRDTERARSSMKDEDARNAWKNAMPLDKFLKLYKKEESGFGKPEDWSYTGLQEDDFNASWVLMNESDENEEAGIPSSFVWPEILIPIEDSGSIPPNRIEHHATSTTNRIFSVGERDEYRDHAEEAFLIKRRLQKIAEKSGELLVSK